MQITIAQVKDSELAIAMNGWRSTKTRSAYSGKYPFWKKKGISKLQRKPHGVNVSQTGF